MRNLLKGLSFLVAVMAFIFLPQLAFGVVHIARSVPRPPPHPTKPTANAQVADGWVICGDDYNQKPTGDGCREDVGSAPDCGFICSKREYKTTSYRDFLKIRKPKAEYLGVQLYYLPNGLRAVIYYRDGK